MRRYAGAMLLGLLPAAASAQSQVELSVGAGIGSSFTRRAPFVFDDQTFGGPYRTCNAGVPAGACLVQGTTDVTFGLETSYSAMLSLGLEARRRVGGPFLVGAGVLGGLAIRSQRIIVGDTGEVVDGRPSVPQPLIDSANNHAVRSTNGVGTLGYLHAGLRWDRGFESRTTIGYRPSSTRVFVEAGGGLLAAVPGGATAGVGHPPALHLAGGLIFKRTSARPLTLSVRYVQALRKRDEATLVDSRLSWAVLQVGWMLH